MFMNIDGCRVNIDERRVNIDECRVKTTTRHDIQLGWPFLQDFLETTGFFTEILTTPVQDS